MSGGTEIGTNTDTFQNIAEGKETLDIRGRESVSALLYGLGSGS
jgi:hypothetical protein